MPSPDVLAEVEAALVSHFGQVPSRASVSFVGVEPIGVLRFEAAAGTVVYVSLGMSRRPMTAASAPMVSESGPRAELILRTRQASESGAGVWRRLAMLAAAPVVEGVVYTPGMTVDLGEQLAIGSRCTGAVVTESDVTPVTTAVGVVDVLEIVPATATELAWCRVHGTTSLWERWVAQDIDLADLGRPAAELT